MADRQVGPARSSTEHGRRSRKDCENSTLYPASISVRTDPPQAHHHRLHRFTVFGMALADLHLGSGIPRYLRNRLELRVPLHINYMRESRHTSLFTL